MDNPRRSPVRSIRRLRAGAATDPVDASLELLAAIELVARGHARRVVLAGIPSAEIVAAEALARAQREDVACALRRDPGSGRLTVVIGPRAP